MISYTVSDPSVPLASDNTGRNNDNTSAVSLVNTCVTLTTENPYNYLLFDLHFVLIYTNSQLRYYYILGAILNVDKTELKNKIKKCKAALKLINWNGNTRENTPVS